MNSQTPEVQPEPPQSPLKTALQLPEPDRENITVLLHNLPKDPVLPWNRYDSPWEPEEESPVAEETAQGESDPNAPEDDRPGSENSPPETTLQQGDPEGLLDPALEETETQILESVPEEAIPEEASEGDPDPVKTFEPGFVNLSPQALEETTLEMVDYPHQAAVQEALEETIAEAESSAEPDEDHGLLSQLG